MKVETELDNYQFPILFASHSCVFDEVCSFVSSAIGASQGDAATMPKKKARNTLSFHLSGKLVGPCGLEVEPVWKVR